MALQHLRSSTAHKRPDPSAMSDGQLALNSASTSPGLFFKNATGALVKAGPVHVGTTAPNASPAVGGTTGNSAGELWLDTSVTPNELKSWDGSAWVSTLPDEVPVSKLADGTARQLLQTDAAGTGVEWTSNIDIPGTLDVTGAAVFDSTITAQSNVTLNAQSDLRFADADSSNWVAFQAPSTVSGNVTWTLPGADGSANQVLTTNGSGTLSFTSPAGGYTVTTTATSKTLADKERCTVTASGQTLTLPASPSAGAEVTITVAGTFTDTVIGRNSSNVMSLAEDLTVDKGNISINLYYVDATRGWRIF